MECEDSLNEITVVDQFCANKKKPKMTKPCEKYACNYAWMESYWSPVSVSQELLNLDWAFIHLPHMFYFLFNDFVNGFNDDLKKNLNRQNYSWSDLIVDTKQLFTYILIEQLY